jgi:hypothetical protein
VNITKVVYLIVNNKLKDIKEDWNKYNINKESLSNKKEIYRKNITSNYVNSKFI